MLGSENDITSDLVFDLMKRNHLEMKILLLKESMKWVKLTQQTFVLMKTS